MKKILTLNLCVLFFIGCSNTPTVVQQNSNANVSNATLTTPKTDELTTVSSHSQDRTDQPTGANDQTTVQKSDKKTKWTQSGNPIDTTGFDSEIKQIQDKIKSNAKDESLKKSLADSFVKRGIALTEARQYASALGDYRKAQKLDPENEEAKKWIAQIISIYESINREYPKEGEEPPSLPFKKES